MKPPRHFGLPNLTALEIASEAFGWGQMDLEPFEPAEGQIEGTARLQRHAIGQPLPVSLIR
jgi:hypothetical protein